jgi:hypothetical protein
MFPETRYSMKGTMMQFPLTLRPLLERAARLFPNVEIVSSRPTTRFTVTRTEKWPGARVPLPLSFRQRVSSGETESPA